MKINFLLTIIVCSVFLLFYALIFELYKYTNTIRYDWVKNIYFYFFIIFLIGDYFIVKHKKIYYIFAPFLICLFLPMFDVIKHYTNFRIQELFLLGLFSYYILGGYVLSVLLLIKEIMYKKFIIKR